MSDETMSDNNDQPAGAIVAAFGGIRPMATKLGVPVSTVQGWKQRDTIPAGRMSEIRQVAAENNITLPVSQGTSDKPDNGTVIEETAIVLPDGSEGNDAEPGPGTGASAKSDNGADTVETEPAPVATSSGGGKASAIAVLALLVALGSAGWLWWSTEGPGAAVDDTARISALEGRIARLAENAGDPGKAAREALSAQLESLRNEIAGLSSADLDGALEPVRNELEQLREQVGAIEVTSSPTPDPALAGRLSDIEATLRNVTENVAANSAARADGLADIENRIATLGERFSGLQQQGAQQEAAAIDAIALTLAASQLRRHIERGQPYRDALTTLESVSSGDGELDAVVSRLARDADAGVASLEELVFSFDDTAIRILDNAPADAENTIIDQILDRARRVVRVRRVGTDLPPESVDGRIARAEFRLREGDVAGAVSVLKELEGGAAEAAQPWVTRARAYVEAGDALESVETMALARLRTASGS